MLHGRMQHNVALSHNKSCLAMNVTKLITSALKKNFLPTIFQFTETVTLKFPTHHKPHQKLCLHYSWRHISIWQTVDETGTLPIEFLCHVAFCNMPQHAEAVPCWCLHYFWHLPHVETALCCILPHSIVWMLLHAMHNMSLYIMLMQFPFLCDPLWATSGLQCSTAHW